MKVELTDPGGGLIQVELSRDQHDRLQIEAGKRVYVKPKRVRVFTTNG